MSLIRRIMTRKVSAQRIRHHGDFHLGQVLYTGKDFVFIDLEGEPARSIADRRGKRSPLRDVVGMVRSFHYAVYACLLSQGDNRDQPRGLIRPEDVPILEPWARVWYVWVSAVYVRSYLDKAKEGSFLPRSWDEIQLLFESYLLEKALYELGYELNHRPDWVRLPLWGILQMLQGESKAAQPNHVLASMPAVATPAQPS